MTQLPIYTGTIIKKVGPKPSKFEDGGLRYMFEIKFSNGTTATVWDGGKNLQAYEYMSRAQVGQETTVEGSYNPDGSMKYSLHESTYQGIQVDPSDYLPSTPPPGPPLTGQVGSTGPMSAPPPPPPPAYTPPQRPSIQPLGENALLHASMRMDDAEKVYRLAHSRAVNLVHDLYEFEDLAQSQPFIARLATTFFLEATPWKLNQEGFNPSEYNHPVFGHTLRTPLAPEKLIAGLRQRAAEEVSINKDTLKKMTDLARIGLENLFGSEHDRHRFGEVVFGKSSSKDWTPGEINAVVRWLNTDKDVNYAIRPDVAIDAYLLREMF